VTTLLLDIGNSRVKWAALDGRRLGAQRAAAHAGWGLADWQREVLTSGRWQRVLAATVAGSAGARTLADAVRTTCGCELELVSSQPEAVGVRNGYRDPSLLGVDRWLAVIAAYHHQARRACCVVDIGTAATVDVVTADGQHLGGFIVPGPGLMVGSLLQGTSDLAQRSAASPPEMTALFADNTRDAIERGCAVTLAALADRCVAELASRGPTEPVLLVTGGAAHQVTPHLKTSHQVVPDLVLRGLALLALD
jgi:type III pantothenate kinase